MTCVDLKSKVGPDGVLTLRVPVGPQHANEDVLVTVEPAGGSHAPNLTRDEWRRLISKTAGSITDPTFRRHCQRDYEWRQELP